MAARSDRELKGTRRGAGHAQGRIRRHAKTRGPEAVCEVNATRRQVPASAACAAAEKSSAGEAGGTIFPHVDRPHLVTALGAQTAVGFWGSGIIPRTCDRHISHCAKI